MDDGYGYRCRIPSSAPVGSGTRFELPVHVDHSS